MLYINLLILLIFVAGLLISRHKTEEWLLKADKKEHSLFFLYPLSHLILTKTGLYKSLGKKKDISKYLGVLDNNLKPELAGKLFCCKRLSSVIFVFLLFNIISILSVLSTDSSSYLINSKYIKRPVYGAGKTNLKLQVKMVGADDQAGQRSYGPYSLELPVNEQAYTEDELEKVFDKSYEYIKNAVLGDNSSFDLIYRRLNFIKNVPGTSITVRWLPDENKLIRQDGSLVNEDIAADGVWTNVTAVLTYAVNNVKQSRKYSMSFKIMPKQYSEEELLQKELKQQLELAEENTGEKPYLELPERLTGFRLIWEENIKGSSNILVLLGLIAGVFTWIANERELEKKLKQRKEQMMIDYPEIINKFTLLINAGMTIKQAWLKIADDYERLITEKDEEVYTGNIRDKNNEGNKDHIGYKDYRNKLADRGRRVDKSIRVSNKVDKDKKRYKGNKDNMEKNGVKRRHAYDEIVIAARELRLGVSEALVYEEFGKRTGLIQYIKFSLLLNQNLKKGNRNLTQQLIYEADEAFAERKELAKRLGETAGTKLLGPMMIMLLIVLLIIMIPAFLTFRI
jgi:hypothetical protein